MCAVHRTDLRTMLLGVQLTVLGFGLPAVWARGWIATLLGESLVVVGTVLVAGGFLAERYRAQVPEPTGETDAP